MTYQSSSPPLIKGIDEIVRISPNRVNYSTLNGKRMETGKQPGNKIRQKYRKFGISGNMAKYVKQEGNAGKNGNLMEPSNRNEIYMIENKVEDDREEDGVTREAQRRKCEDSGRSA